MRLPDRLVANAEGLARDYARANDILQSAVKDALPWAVPLAARGVVPTADKIERLCVQCLAILMATYPDEFKKPVRGFGGDG